MASEGIFQGEDGRKTKFFIQKDLNQETIEMLRSAITTNGGRIETKVPIHGFVLIEPESPEGARLVGCWDTPERPLRYFVPHTFVTACLEAQRIIPQVFRQNGVSLRMHIHSSINNNKFIERLRDRIWHSGGDPLAEEDVADVVISDENAAGFRALVERYDHFPDRFVETVSWVDQCVGSGVYENTGVVKKNLGGRVPGNKRIEFTASDDHHLVKYIACRIPDPEMRGRTGNKLYQDLCSRLDLYPWAERHPWQSWRERYKNNVSRFSSLIAAYLQHNPVSESGKGQHGYFRASTSPRKSQLRQSAERVESPGIEPQQEQESPADVDSDWGSQWDVRIGNAKPPSWTKGKRKALGDDNDTIRPNKRKKGSRDGVDKSPEAIPPPEGEAVGGRDREPGARPPSDSHQGPSLSPRGDPNGAVDTLPLGNSQTETEPEEGVIGPETQALLEAQKELLRSACDSLSKNHTSNDGQPEQQGDSTILSARPISTFRSMADDVDLALTQTACECRFVVDEVMEVYEELNRDLDATRALFKELRAYINKRRRHLKKSL